MKKMAALISLLLILSSLFSCGELDDDVSSDADMTDTTAEIATTDDDTTSDDPDPDSDNVSTPLFWKVSGNGYDGSFYLLGSIHVGLDDTNVYPEEITDAWNSCEYIAVESDVIELEKSMYASIRAMRKFVYTDGTKIYDHIDEDIYSKAVFILTQCGIYNSNMDYYMPVLWAQLIDQCLLDKTKFDSDLGVDMYFLSDAKENGKEVLEIEDYMYTYTGLASLSELTQKLLLESYVDDEYAEGYEENTEELYSAWKCGELEYLEELIVGDSDLDFTNEEEMRCAEEYYTLMVDSRNIIMTEKADDYMKNDYDVFYIAGLAHMLGDNGIVEGLRGLGYDVELVDLK